MCRIEAFPPNFPREEAISILSNFENKNTDGTGSAYVKPNGEFVVDKWAKSLGWVINNRRSFLSHMPYNKGWTIVHLRAASHGKNTKDNTHPFVVGPWAFIHNGIWSEYNLVKLAMSKSAKIVGETDSEVAANFWNIIGPKKFSEVITYSGVFMGLHKSGHLWIAKTNGDLEIQALKRKQVLLVSELNPSQYESRVDALNGWYHFNSEGHYVSHKENSNNWSSGYPYSGGISSCSSALSNSKTSHPHTVIYDHRDMDYEGGMCFNQHVSRYCDGD